MSHEYWMVKDGEQYFSGNTWTPERLLGKRYISRAGVRDGLALARRYRSAARSVHVRVRPRSERLWMARRLAAWWPIVFDSLEMARAQDEGREADTQDWMLKIVGLAKDLKDGDKP